MDFRFACTAAVVMSGAYPLRAVGKTIAAAFGMEAVTFDYHPNKGPKKGQQLAVGVGSG